MAGLNEARGLLALQVDKRRARRLALQFINEGRGPSRSPEYFSKKKVRLA